MDCRMPGFPVLHYLLEFAQTQVHWVSDAIIQPSHPLSLPPPPALNLSQHQGLFQWVSPSHQVGQSIGAPASALVLPMNIQGWFPLGFTGLISLLSGSQGLFTGGKGAWDCVPTCPCLGPCIQLWFDFNFTAAVRLEPISLRGRWYWAWTWESNRLGFESYSTTAPFQAEWFGHPPSPGISWVALAAPVFQHNCVGCKWPT